MASSGVGSRTEDPSSQDGGLKSAESNWKQKITDIKNECIKIPSIPLSLHKVRDKQIKRQKLSKMMANGNSRRMMTYLRISENI